jgi:hypothetical protein
MKRTQHTIDHIHLTNLKPFVAVRADFEDWFGLVDEAPYQAVTNGEHPQAARPGRASLPSQRPPCLS